MGRLRAYRFHSLTHSWHVNAAVWRRPCVLHGRVFRGDLAIALRSWRARVEHYGLDFFFPAPFLHSAALGFEDGMAPLLDLRFADDLLLFAVSKEEFNFMLDELIGALQEVGLVFNASNFFVLTTEAQPPNGAEVSVAPLDCSHKWLGCFLTTKHVQGHGSCTSGCCATRTFRWVYASSFSMLLSLQSACFAAGHRTLYPRDVRRHDIEMRKMLRRMILPPVGIDWSAPWHVIRHSWHARIDTVVHQFAFLPWSAVVTIMYWKFAANIKTLPPQKWLRRCLDWTPPNNRRCGRPPFAWDEKVRVFFRWKQLGSWKETSTDTWHRFESEFVAFITGSQCF